MYNAFLVPDTIRSKSQWKEQVKETADFYKSDLPIPLTLRAELDRWESKWSLWHNDVPQVHRVHLYLVQVHCFQTYILF